MLNKKTSQSKTHSYEGLKFIIIFTVIMAKRKLLHADMIPRHLEERKDLDVRWNIYFDRYMKNTRDTDALDQLKILMGHYCGLNILIGNAKKIHETHDDRKTEISFSELFSR